MPTALPPLNLALPRWVGALDAAERLLMRAVHRDGVHDEAALLHQRLVPDMFCLGQQVQVLCDSLQGAAALLVGDDSDPCVGQVFNRSAEDQLSVPDSHLTQSLARVHQARACCLAASEMPPPAPDAVVVVARPGPVPHIRRFAANAFVWHFVMPNAYFHLSMMYALLRSAGVAVGKADYEGPPAYTLDSAPD